MHLRRELELNPTEIVHSQVCYSAMNGLPLKRAPLMEYLQDRLAAKVAIDLAVDVAISVALLMLLRKNLHKSEFPS
jgi:hypothetical protein